MARRSDLGRGERHGRKIGQRHKDRKDSFRETTVPRRQRQQCVYQCSQREERRRWLNDHVQQLIKQSTCFDLHCLTT